MQRTCSQKATKVTRRTSRRFDPGQSSLSTSFSLPSLKMDVGSGSGGRYRNFHPQWRAQLMKTSVAAPRIRAGEGFTTLYNDIFRAGPFKCGVPPSPCYAAARRNGAWGAFLNAFKGYFSMQSSGLGRPALGGMGAWQPSCKAGKGYFRGGGVGSAAGRQCRFPSKSRCSKNLS
jgi:hypothetical protein